MKDLLSSSRTNFKTIQGLSSASGSLQTVTCLRREDLMVNFSCTNHPITQKLGNLEVLPIREEFTPFPGHRTEPKFCPVPGTKHPKFGTSTT